MKTLLYATDCSQMTSTALQYAYRLSTVLNADLHVIHVYDLSPFTTTNVRSRGVLEKNFFQDQHQVLSNYCEQHLKHELGIKKIHFHIEKDSAISKAILNTAEKISADLVLVGIKKANTLRGFFSGNVANELMKNLACPMLILPDVFHYHGLSTLLYATDFEESDIYAIESLVKLAEPYGALLKVIHIPRVHETDTRSRMEAFKQVVSNRISYPEIVFSMQRAEDVESGIHNYIDKDMPEMLIMMEREQDTLWNKWLHKDMVKTMENEISIPLLVFNKKTIDTAFSEALNNTSAFAVN